MSDPDPPVEGPAPRPLPLGMPRPAPGGGSPVFQPIVRGVTAPGPSFLEAARGRLWVLALGAFVIVAAVVVAARDRGKPAGPPADAAHRPPSARVVKAFSAGMLRAVLDNYEAKAEAGDVEAQLILGEHYQTGDELHTDRFNASRWFERAAAQGSAKAKVALYLLHRGCCAEKARAWLLEAAEAGDPRATELLERGDRDAEGKGTPEELVRLVEGRRAKFFAALDENMEVSGELLASKGLPIDAVAQDRARASYEDRLLPSARLAELAAAVRAGDAQARELLLKEAEDLLRTTQAVESSTKQFRRQLEGD